MDNYLLLHVRHLFKLKEDPNLKTIGVFTHPGMTLDDFLLAVAEGCKTYKMKPVDFLKDLLGEPFALLATRKIKDIQGK